MDKLNLVHDLAVILISAGVFTVITKALRQPVVLGYIIAGFLVGPHVGFFPNISNTEVVSQWSEIGIIFLLFALGLEFSFKKLFKVGSSSLTMFACQFLGMMAVGIMLGQAMGWSTIESLFLGGMLSVSSSSAIVVKVYDELKLKESPHAPAVFGALVIQDIMSIILMVILPTIALSQGFSGVTALSNIARLVFFLALWFMVGIYLIPTLLQWAHKYLNDEILLIISIGLCFTMVTIASMVGFSSALGAFVMGSILSETIEDLRITKLVSSLKYLFGAIFFVSVGMMLDPSVIVEYRPLILIISLSVIIGVSFFASLGALLSGNGITNSVRSGFSLAQAGEFTFILATLGISLGLIREFIYPVIIAVSVITVFFTPYMIKLADPVARMLKRRLPESLIQKIDVPVKTHHDSESELSEWKNMLKWQLIRVFSYGILAFSVMIGARMLLPGILHSVWPGISTSLSNTLNVVITIALMSPFLFIMVSENAVTNKSARALLKKNSLNVWLLLAFSISKMAIAVVFIFMVLATYFTLNAWEVVFVVLITALTFGIFTKYSYRYFIRLEKKFMSNLTRKEDLMKKMKPVTVSVQEKMSDYDVRLAAVNVSPSYDLIGRKLSEQPFRQIAGVNIVKITRGGKSIFIPSGDEIIYPYDRLVAVGTADQVAAFEDYMSHYCDEEPQNEGEFILEKTVLSELSYLTGKKIKDLNLRPWGCSVISVVRNAEVITNPDPDFVFNRDDLVWIAGVSDSVHYILDLKSL